jgi:hypothetical protein
MDLRLWQDIFYYGVILSVATVVLGGIYLGIMYYVINRNLRPKEEQEGPELEKDDFENINAPRKIWMDGYRWAERGVLLGTSVDELLETLPNPNLEFREGVVAYLTHVGLIDQP